MLASEKTRRGPQNRSSLEFHYLGDWESSSDSAACGMEPNWPQLMPELANPPQEVGFPHGGALLPPAGHSRTHTGGGSVAPGRSEMSGKVISCSRLPGQVCSRSPRRSSRTTCRVQKRPGGAEGQVCDPIRGAFPAGSSSRGATGGVLAPPRSV